MLHLTPREKSVTYILIALMISYGACLSVKSHEGFPTSMEVDKGMPYLSDKPVDEDGYYMLTVAWNTAEGKMFSYNYGLRTTGVQPLGTLIYAGVAWLIQQFNGDKWVFVRAVILLGSVLISIFAVLVGRITSLLFQDTGRRNTSFILGFCLTLLNFKLFRLYTYGLETGFYLIGIAICVIWTLRQSRIDGADAVKFGFIVGVVGLTRLDFGVVFAMLSIVFLACDRMSIRAVGISGTTALLVVSPWFLWIYRITGNWFPSSGVAQRSLIGESNVVGRVSAVVEAIVTHATPWIYTRSWVPGAPLILLGILSLLTLGVVVYMIRSSASVRLDWQRVSTLGGWGLATGVLLFIYPIFFWPTYFYGRYTAPIVVVLIPFLSALVVWLVTWDYQIFIRRLVISALVICFGFWAAMSLHSGRVKNSLAISAGYVSKRVPLEYKVGAFQSGIMGYYNSNVVNLDGKIDHRVIRYSNGRGLSQYMDSTGVDVIIDWPVFFDRFDDGYMESRWKSCGPKIPGDAFTCQIRRSLPSLSEGDR